MAPRKFFVGGNWKCVRPPRTPTLLISFRSLAWHDFDLYQRRARAERDRRGREEDRHRAQRGRGALGRHRRGAVSTYTDLPFGGLVTGSICDDLWFGFCSDAS
jgi:hypothetical protein